MLPLNPKPFQVHQHTIPPASTDSGSLAQLHRLSSADVIDALRSAKRPGSLIEPKTEAALGEERAQNMLTLSQIGLLDRMPGAAMREHRILAARVDELKATRSEILADQRRVEARLQELRLAEKKAHEDLASITEARDFASQRMERLIRQSANPLWHLAYFAGRCCGVTDTLKTLKEKLNTELAALTNQVKHGRTKSERLEAERKASEDVCSENRAKYSAMSETLNRAESSKRTISQYVEVGSDGYQLTREGRELLARLGDPQGGKTRCWRGLVSLMQREDAELALLKERFLAAKKVAIGPSYGAELAVALVVALLPNDQMPAAHALLSQFKQAKGSWAEQHRLIHELLILHPRIKFDLSPPQDNRELIEEKHSVAEQQSREGVLDLQKETSRGVEQRSLDGWEHCVDLLLGKNTQQRALFDQNLAQMDPDNRRLPGSWHVTGLLEDMLAGKSDRPLPSTPEEADAAFQNRIALDPSDTAEIKAKLGDALLTYPSSGCPEFNACAMVALQAACNPEVALKASTWIVFAIRAHAMLVAAQQHSEALERERFEDRGRGTDDDRMSHVAMMINLHHMHMHKHNDFRSSYGAF